MSADTYQVQPGQRFTAVIGGMPSETGQFRPDYPPPDLLPAISAPAAAPAAAAIVSAGLLGIGSYRYSLTNLTAYGETTAGPEVSVATISGHQQVQLSAIPPGPSGTIARRVYRTVVNGAAGSGQLLATINDNTTTTLLDNLADGSLTQTVPFANQSGQLGVQIRPLAGGTPFLSRTTAGIQQQAPHSAVYAIDLIAPGSSGDYTVLWDYNQGAAPFFTQTLSVDTSIPVTSPSGSSNAPVYVQQDEVLDDPDYITSGKTAPNNSAEFDALIVTCELEIDSILGFWIRDPTTGRKINLTNIVPVAPISPFPGELFAPYQRGITIYAKAALKRAVIAQLIYHLEMGPDFFTTVPRQTVAGPQFSYSYGQNQGQPKIAPKVGEHLAGMGLVRRIGRALI